MCTVCTIFHNKYIVVNVDNIKTATLNSNCNHNFVTSLRSNNVPAYIGAMRLNGEVITPLFLLTTAAFLYIL